MITMQLSVITCQASGQLITGFKTGLEVISSFKNSLQAQVRWLIDRLNVIEYFDSLSHLVNLPVRFYLLL